MKIYEWIFELLFCLCVNIFWLVMYGCFVFFYFILGNKEVVDKFGIFIGIFYCELMMWNINGEWKWDGVGEYDYVYNSVYVLFFWE